MPKIEIKYFKSKVGTRIVLLFILCALGPLLVMAGLSYYQVMQELNEQARRKLHQESKSLGMAVYERLTFLENEISLISSRIISGTSFEQLDKPYKDHLKERFRSISLVTDKHTDVFMGEFQHSRISLTTEEQTDLQSGRAIIITTSYENEQHHIFLIKSLMPGNSDQGIIYADISPSYLVGVSEGNPLQGVVEFCLLDYAGNSIYTSTPSPPVLPEEYLNGQGRSQLADFTWRCNGIEYTAGLWQVFLKFRFNSKYLSVITSINTKDILVPMDEFKTIFPLVAILSFWIVLFLSLVQVRRSLVPLQKLTEGTQKISEQQFGSRVLLDSKDEFEDLADSFNLMADQLGRQFNSLTTRSQIDRAVLSSLKTGDIENRVLSGILQLFPCAAASMSWLEQGNQNILNTHSITRENPIITPAAFCELTLKDRERLQKNPKYVELRAEGELPSYLKPLMFKDIIFYLVLPLFVNKVLKGLIAIGFSKSLSPSENAVKEARQLADQAAVAFSNAALVKEVDQFNWGTLTALARAVDEKSSWTAGHSERVTQIALTLGNELGLSNEQQVYLYRGGLLHDVGKIGIPLEILDKPGRLTDDEFKSIREHPNKGVRILEPIKAFAQIISMVQQHHERFDGKGYPMGLAGEQITFKSRILTVADVFDALISDRPYRSGMSFEKVFEIMGKESGGLFDPNVLECFFTLIENIKNSLSKENTAQELIVSSLVAQGDEISKLLKEAV